MGVKIILVARKGKKKLKTDDKDKTDKTDGGTDKSDMTLRIIGWDEQIKKADVSV